MRSDGGAAGDRDDLKGRGHYDLDTKIEADKFDIEGHFERLAHFIAEAVWALHRLVGEFALEVFLWAFSADLINGPEGALGPLGSFIESAYGSVFGASFLTAAISGAGIWGIYNGVVRRAYTRTLSQLGLSVVLVCVALFVVKAPTETLGGFAQLSTDFSQTTLANFDGSVFSGARAGDTRISETLHKTLIEDPWLVLNFGGSGACAPREASAVDGSCRSLLERPDGSPGLARYLLALPPGADRERVRDAIHKPRALRTSATPSGVVDSTERALKEAGLGSPPSFGDEGKRAVEIQTEGHGWYRVMLALLIFITGLGATALIFMLSAGIILSQLVMLLIAAFAPVALVAATIPGFGHRLFGRWAQALIAAGLAKVIYTLILTAVLAVSNALVAGLQSQGILMTIGLTGVFWWAVLLGRNRIIGAFTSAIGEHASTNSAAAGADGVNRAARAMGGTAMMANRVARASVQRVASRSFNSGPQRSNETVTSGAGTPSARGNAPSQGATATLGRVSAAQGPPGVSPRAPGHGAATAPGERSITEKLGVGPRSWGEIDPAASLDASGARIESGSGSAFAQQITSDRTTTDVVARERVSAAAPRELPNRPSHTPRRASAPAVEPLVNHRTDIRDNRPAPSAAEVTAHDLEYLRQRLKRVEQRAGSGAPATSARPSPEVRGA